MKTRFAGYRVPLLERSQLLDRATGKPGYPDLSVVQPWQLEVEAQRAEAITFLRHGWVRGGDFTSYQTAPSVAIAAGAAVVGTTQAVIPSAVSPLFAGGGGATAGVGGFWYQGRSLRIVAKGALTTASSAQGNCTLDWKVATSQNVTTGNTLGAGPAIALAASQTSICWWFEGHVTCRSVGAAGTLFGIGQLVLGSAATTDKTYLIPAATPATATVDTTANSALNMLVTLGSASDSMTVHQCFWEVMN